MSYYQINSRKYYIISLLGLTLIIVIALIVSQVVKKIKADIMLPQDITLPDTPDQNNNQLITPSIDSNPVNLGE